MKSHRDNFIARLNGICEVVMQDGKTFGLKTLKLALDFFEPLQSSAVGISREYAFGMEHAIFQIEFLPVNSPEIAFDEINRRLLSLMHWLAKTFVTNPLASMIPFKNIRFPDRGLPRETKTANALYLRPFLQKARSFMEFLLEFFSCCDLQMKRQFNSFRLQRTSGSCFRYLWENAKGTVACILAERMNR